MCSKLNMVSKIQYSSLLKITIYENLVRVKGPLGINSFKIPQNILVNINNEINVIEFRSNTKKNISFQTIVTFFKNICRSLVFGDLISLELNGLGLKFVSIEKKKNSSGNLNMGLGFSNIINHSINYNRSNFFLKNSRDVLIYSTDFAYLQNEAFTIFKLKVPDKYKQKGFTIKKFI